MISDAQARVVVKTAWGQYDPKTPLGLGTAQLIQATGRREGDYGSAFGGAHNWGAVQPAADHGQGCPPGTTPGKDSTPGGGVFTACLKVYPDDVAGCLDMIRYMVKLSDKSGRQALYDGDNAALARAMYNGHYYLGFHPNAKEKAEGLSKEEAAKRNVADRISWLQSAAVSIAKNLKEPLAIDGSAPSGTGSGAAVGGGIMVFGAALIGAGLLLKGRLRERDHRSG